jgi:endonuclease/exonuclease/phosphatase family metal-dependent hydrolase
MIFKPAHYICLSLVLLLLLSGCNKYTEPDYNQRTSYYKNVATGYTSNSLLTCVTYNIQLGFMATQDPWDANQTGADMNQIKRIADILRSTNADIIALQEVPRNRYNAVVKGFVETLAAELGMNYAFGAHGYNDPYGIYPVNGEWGNAILSTFEIEAITNHQVEYVNQWERRSLLHATLKINDSTTINAISLHHLPSADGLPNTASYVQSLQGEVILMGDFNYLGEITEFKNIGFSDVDSTYALHGIDRLFVNKAFFSVSEIGTIPDTLLVSDHWANYARLKF